MEWVADQSSERSYSFDRWLLQSDGLLLHDGKGVHLAPKELHVFRLLLAASGSLVSKDWLLDQVWPRCNIAEESLTRCIYSLRKTLGAQKSYIKTVYGKGYSFIGKVGEQAAASVGRSSLLVLPVALDGAQFGQDLQGELISCLASAFGDTLCVIPAGLTAANVALDNLAWVERLEPDYYLSARCVVREGEHCVRVELVRTADHGLLHSELVPLAGVRPIKEKVTSIVAQRLPGLRSLSAMSTAYPVALSYLNGLLGLQAYTVEGLQDALVQFLECLRLDASYAPPWCGLADTYLALGAMGLCDAHKATSKAQTAVAQALALEPGSLEATARLALLSGLSGQFDAAEALFRAPLLADKPDKPGYLYFYAWYLWCRGEHKLAQSSLELCLTDAPACVPAWVLSVRIALSQSADSALAVIGRSSAELACKHPVLAALHALVLQQCGQAVAAVELIRRAGLNSDCPGEPGRAVRYVTACASSVLPPLRYEGWPHLVDPKPGIELPRNQYKDLGATFAWQAFTPGAMTWPAAQLGERDSPGYVGWHEIRRHA